MPELIAIIDYRSKDDVIAAEQKLQDLGYVQYVENLTEDQQNMLQENVIQNFIPWHSVSSSSFV